MKTSSSSEYIIRDEAVTAKPSATPRSTAPTDSRVYVELPNTLYVVCWLLIWSLHTCCAVYLFKLAELYWYLDRPFLTYYANLIQPESERHYKKAAAAFGLVGVIHLWCALELILLSYGAQELVLSLDDVSSDRTESLSLKKMRSFGLRVSTFTKVTLNRFSRVSRIVVKLDSLWSSWFGRRGVFGLESPFFDLIFLTREFLEIALQSFQAHQTSEMITTVWLNRLFVVLVVINCWTTPLVQRVILRHSALGRLCGITLDLGLSVGTNMIIPVIIFLPYFNAWHPDRNAFDAEQLYDDVWFTNMVMENRLLYARSFVDFVAKFVPHLSVLFSHSCIKTHLVRVGRFNRRILPVDDQPLRPVSTAEALPTRASQYIVDNQPAQPVSTDTPPPPTAPHSSNTARFRLDGWKTLVVHTVLILWGCVLLGLHISSSLSTHDELGGCKQTIRVWFPNKKPCSTYEYNCFRRHDITLIDALGDIEPSTLLTLIISHCRDLVVPREIQNFPNLLSFELFNVTLREWSATAGISPTVHPSLVALLLIFVNMTALPDGLCGHLPASLKDIEIAYSNLTTLPDDLHDHWHALDEFYLEFSPLRDFPSTLTNLAVYDLSLVGNQIETVEPLAQLPFTFFSLALSQNPLRVLPTRLNANAAFGYLSLEHTAITTLPLWMKDARIVEETAFLKGSPVCGSSDLSLPALDAASWPRVACEKSDPRGGGRYPLDVMLPRRRP